MRCRHCGAEISDGSLFCPQCGGSFSSSTPSASESAPTSAATPAARVASFSLPRPPRVVLVVALAALVILLAASAVAGGPARGPWLLHGYDPQRDAGSFDERTDGGWTSPSDGPLTAVLYADGDLVFQYGAGTTPGRGVEAVWSAQAADGSDLFSSQELGGMRVPSWAASNGVRSVSTRCRVTAPPDLVGAFYGCIFLSDVSGLASWDTASVTSMRNMFCRCQNLTDLSALASWDTSHVEDMSRLFYGCPLQDLSALASWDTSSVTSMRGMFELCAKLTDLSALSPWDTSRVKDMGFLFGFCDSLSDVSGLASWDLSSATDMEGMFERCVSLSDVSALASWDTSSVQEMSYAFHDCSSLSDPAALSSWDISSVTKMTGMFEGCPGTPPPWYVQDDVSSAPAEPDEDPRADEDASSSGALEGGSEPAPDSGGRDGAVDPFAPFWGVWTFASKSESEAEEAAAQARAEGFDGAAVYLTTDWSNLNPEPWYCVSLGSGQTEQSVDIVLSKAHNSGHPDAYKKYSGDHV